MHDIHGEILKQLIAVDRTLVCIEYLLYGEKQQLLEHGNFSTSLNTLCDIYCNFYG